jgi:hypothetical protein
MRRGIILALVVNLATTCLPVAGRATAATPKNTPAATPVGVAATDIAAVVSCLEGIAAKKTYRLQVRLNAVDSLGSIASMATQADLQKAQASAATALRQLLCFALPPDDEKCPPPSKDPCKCTTAPANDHSKKVTTAPAADPCKSKEPCKGVDVMAAQDCTSTCVPCKDFFCHPCIERKIFVLHVVRALGGLGPAAIHSLDALAKALVIDDPVVKSEILNAQQAILTPPQPAAQQTANNTADNNSPSASPSPSAQQLMALQKTLSELQAEITALAQAPAAAGK